MKNLEIFKLGLREFDKIILENNMSVEIGQGIENRQAKIYNAYSCFDIHLSQYYYELSISVKDVVKKKEYPLHEVFKKKDLFQVEDEYLKNLVEKYNQETNEKVKLILEFKIISYRLETYCIDLLKGDFSQLEKK